MSRFATLWTAEQAAAYLLGVDLRRYEMYRHGRLPALSPLIGAMMMQAEIEGRTYHPLAPLPHEPKPLQDCKRLALRIEEAAINGDHFPDYLPNRRVKPMHAIRWALAQADIEVCPECREWYSRMVPDAGDPVPVVDLPKVRRSHVDERLDRLEQLFQDIEQQAKKAGIPYERSATPGDKMVLRQFLKQCDPELARMLNSAFADDLKTLGVRFLPAGPRTVVYIPDNRRGPL